MSPTLNGEDMTGIILRARRLRLPSRRTEGESRSQSELATDLGYSNNSIALLEREANPLGKRGTTLHLAICTLERAAGLVEWQNLLQSERDRWLLRARGDAQTFKSRRPSGKTQGATKKRAGKKASSKKKL